MPQDSHNYPVSARSRQNEYTCNINNSVNIVKSKEEPVVPAGLKSLMMVNKKSIPNVTNKNGDSNDSGIGLPSLPLRKLSQQTFLKEMARSTNPIIAQNQNRDHFTKRCQTADPHRTHVKVQHPEYVGSMEDRSQNDSDSTDYLTPIDPPTYKDCSNKNFSTNLSGSDSSQHKSDRPRNRFDSGLGDCESVQGSSSVRFSTSPTNSFLSLSSPHLSTHLEQHYEDIDQYNNGLHQSNHQPQKSSINKLEGDSKTFGQLSHVDISEATNFDTEDGDLVINTSMAETVLVPLHGETLPHTYMPLNTSRHMAETWKLDKPSRGNCCFIVVLLLTILLISLTALSFSIYLLMTIKTTYVKDTQSDLLLTNHSEEAINNLKYKIEDLIQENAALKDVLLAQEKNLTSYIEQKASQLSSQQQNLSNTIELMEETFDAKIAHISLTPGPQGPPGVANFSLCVSRSFGRSAIASTTEPAETSYLPTETEIQWCN